MRIPFRSKIVFKKIDRNCTKTYVKLFVKETVRVTLRYLCTGDSQVTIGTSYRITPTTMGRIISETCRAIWYVLSKKGFIKAPTSKKEWLDNVTEFDSKWNFPHCVGAIDGKHTIVQALLRSGSTFFNYKKSFSIVSLAVCNTNYEFTLAHVGGAGRQTDGGIYNNSKLGLTIDRNLLNIPEPTTINEYSVTKKISICLCCRLSFSFETFYVMASS